MPENSVWGDTTTSLCCYPPCHSRGAASDDQHIWCLGNLCDNRGDTWCDKQHECAWQLFWDGAYSALSKATRGDNQALPGWASSSPRPRNDGCKMTSNHTDCSLCKKMRGDKTKAIFHNIMARWSVLAKVELFYLPFATWLLSENGGEQVGNWAEMKGPTVLLCHFAMNMYDQRGLSYPGQEPEVRRQLDNPAGLHLLLLALPKTRWG